MQISPTFSIKVPENPDVLSDDRLNSLALQYSMAQGQVSDQQMDNNKYRLSLGSESQMRSELHEKAIQESRAFAPKLLDSALTEGNVSLAEQVVNQGVPQPSRDMVMENFAAEYGSVIKDHDTAEIVRPDDIGLDVSKNAKLLAINNAYKEMQDEFKKQYLPPEGEQYYMPPVGGDIVTDPRIANLVIDGLLMNINSVYAYAKSGFSTLLTFPGTASQTTAEELFGADVTDEQFASRLEDTKNHMRDYFISDAWNKNPLAATSAFLDSLGTGQLDNPVFLELRSIAKVINEKGEEEANILGQSFDPNSTIDRVVTNQWFQNVVDNPILDLPLALSGVDLLRIVLGSSTAAHLLGNQVKAGKITAQNWRYITQMNYPGGIQSPDLLANVQKFSGIVGQGLEEAVEPLRVKGSARQIADEQDKLRRTEFPGNNLAYFEHRTQGPNQFINVNLQARSGNPFYTEASARQAAIAQGYADFTVVPNGRGSGFLIQLRRSIDESKWMDNTIPLDARLRETLFGGGKRAYSPNVTGTREQRFGGTSAANSAAHYSKQFGIFQEAWTAMSTDELGKLSELILKGMRTTHPSDPTGKTFGKWFNESEINQHYLMAYGRLPSTKEKTGYYAFRMSSDLDYILMNKRKYDEASSAGLNHWSFEDVPGIKDPILGRKVVNKQAIPEGSRILLPSGNVVDKAGAAIEINDNAFAAIRVSGRMDHNGREITHIIQQDSKIKSGGLNPYLLGYTEGGSRRYANPWLVKQERGSNTPSTHAIFPSEDTAKKYAEQMSQLQARWKTYQTSVSRLGSGASQLQLNALRRQVDADIQAIHDGYSANRIQDEIQSGKFNLNSKFEVVWDREALPSKGLPGEQNLQLYQDRGKLYYSPRGEHLTDGYIGHFAEVVPPFEALAHQLEHATKMAGYSNFAIRDVNAWMQKYGKGLKLNEPNVGFPTPYQLFRDGEWRPNPADISFEVKEIAQAQREHILRELRHITPTSAKIIGAKVQAAKTLAKITGDSKFLAWLPESIKKGSIVTNSDAINFLKAVNYTRTMGAYYIGQFFLQGSAFAMAVARSPVYGALAFKDAMPIMWASMADYNNKVIKLLDTRASLALGYKAGDFTELMYDWKRTALREVGKTEGTLDTANIIENLQGPTLRMLRSVERGGRYPAYKGEEFVRSVCFGIARREAIDLAEKGKMVRASDEFIEFIRGRTNELQNNSMAGASTWWQRNEVTGLYMQMKQWGWKMSETLLGLDNSSTTKEKIGMLSASLILYGASGFPGGQDIADFLYKETGRKPDEEEIKSVYLGSIDWIMRNVFGEDSAVSARLSAGDTLPSIYRDWIGEGVTASSMLGNLVGLTSDTVSSVMEKSSNLGQILQAARMQQISETAVLYDSDLVLSEFGEMFASYSAYTKGYIAWKYGLIINKNGDSVVNSGKNGFSPLLRALGFSSGPEHLKFRADRQSKEHDQMLWDVAKVGAAYRIDVAMAKRDKDETRVKHLEEQYSTWAAGIDAADKTVILDRVNIVMGSEPNIQKMNQNNITWKWGE